MVEHHIDYLVDYDTYYCVVGTSVDEVERTMLATWNFQYGKVDFEYIKTDHFRSALLTKWDVTEALKEQRLNILIGGMQNKTYKPRF